MHGITSRRSRRPVKRPRAWTPALEGLSWGGRRKETDGGAAQNKARPRHAHVPKEETSLSNQNQEHKMKYQYEACCGPVLRLHGRGCSGKGRE